MDTYLSKQSAIKLKARILSHKPKANVEIILEGLVRYGTTPIWAVYLDGIRQHGRNWKSKASTKQV